MGRIKLPVDRKRENYTFTLLQSEVQMLESMSKDKNSRTLGLRNLMTLMTKLFEKGKFDSADVEAIISIYGE